MGDAREDAVLPADLEDGYSTGGAVRLLFQLPWLPERALGWRDGVGLTRLLQASSRSGAFSAADLVRYRAARNQPGALTAAVNWYRAVVRHRPRVRGVE
ncbi:MAG TPA: hypothetical protein VIO57_17920 [Chloroflexota bacterium]